LKKAHLLLCAPPTRFNVRLCENSKGSNFFISG
jgi:hypothetical protein